MEQEPLTKKQKKVYDYIVNFINENEYSPTVREICKDIGLSSPATAYGYIEKLRDKGYLESTEGAKRAIKIVDKNRPSYKELKETINKAIEFINNDSNYDDSDFESRRFQNDLLKILERTDN